MIKSKTELDSTGPGKLFLDLTGPDGNAFVILALARQLAEIVGKDPAEIELQMTSSDYENLITVFDEHFGEYVDLYL